MGDTREVWKFPISYDRRQVVNLPADAKVLHFDRQGSTERCDLLWIWAEVDPSQGINDSRIFCLVGTGHPMPAPVKAKDVLTYIGTVLTDNGQFVWHLYEEGASDA